MCSKRTLFFPVTKSTALRSTVLDTNGEVVVIEDDDDDPAPRPIHTLSHLHIHPSDVSSSCGRGKIGSAQDDDQTADSRPKRRKMNPSSKTDLTSLIPKDRVRNF